MNNKKSRVKDGNYYVVQSFMVKELKLKGLEKDVYAIIFGFSQAEGQRFNGSLQYLADWTCSSKQSIMNSLKKLVEKGLIKKTANTINGVKFVEYEIIDYTTLITQENKQESKQDEQKCKIKTNKSVKSSIQENGDKTTSKILQKCDKTTRKELQKCDNDNCKCEQYTKNAIESSKTITKNAVDNPVDNSKNATNTPIQKNRGVCKKVDGGIQKSCMGGIQETCTNNIYIDNIKDNIEKEDKKDKKDKRVFNPQKANSFSLELIKIKYIKKDDINIGLYNSIFNELIDKYSYELVRSCLYYFTQRMKTSGKVLKDESGKVIENRLAYFKSSIENNLKIMNHRNEMATNNNGIYNWLNA